MNSVPGALTLLLHRMKAGDRDSESELFEKLYNELRRIARNMLATERNQTLSPTGLVHCAYLRLREIDPKAFKDHQHFLRVADTILAVNNALQRLQSRAPDRHDVVELHYFAGYTFEEVANILGISDRTAKRHWVIARTLLRADIDGSTGAQSN
jgi:DNA-directed RNA polymerase specialized sigma24 family protein